MDTQLCLPNATWSPSCPAAHWLDVGSLLGAVVPVEPSCGHATACICGRGDQYATTCLFWHMHVSSPISVYWLTGHCGDFSGVPRSLVLVRVSLPASLGLPGACEPRAGACLLVRSSLAGREKRNSDSPRAGGAEQTTDSGSPTLCWDRAPAQIQAENLDIGAHSQPGLLFFFLIQISVCVLYD